MLWQDAVIAGASIIFMYALVPQVFKGFKEKKSHITIQTSFLTAIALYVVAGAQLTLHLYAATIITSLTAGLWTLLLLQCLAYR